MKVTIDPGTLLFEIQRFNPHADLTGLKAYLFDLMTGLDDAPIGSVASVSAEPPPQPIESAEKFPEPLEALSQLLPEQVRGDAVAAVAVHTPHVPLNRTVKVDRSEREARRARAKELSEMSTKDILAQLLPQKGPNENGQFVEPGEAGGGGSSDEAFG